MKNIINILRKIRFCLKWRITFRQYEELKREQEQITY